MVGQQACSGCGVTGAIGVPSDEALAETPPFIQKREEDMEQYIQKIQKLFKGNDEDEVEVATQKIQMKLRPESVNIMELALPDLMAVADEEFREVEIEVALDSGACDHVINKCDIPGYTVVPSAGSMRGLHFVAANGDVIDNLGQATVNLAPHDSKVQVQSTFQVAAVSRPLYSATKMADQGCTIAMDKHSAVVSKGGKPVAKFLRKRGLYLCKMTLKAPRIGDAKPAVDFPRPATGA